MYATISNSKLIEYKIFTSVKAHNNIKKYYTTLQGLLASVGSKNVDPRARLHETDD
jgi:hypothetical protein